MHTRTLGTPVKGGSLTYHIMSTLDLEFTCLRTSDSMEVFGAMVVLALLASLNYGEKELIQVLDGDSRAYKVAKTYFRTVYRYALICARLLCLNVQTRLICSNHIPTNKTLDKVIVRVHFDQAVKRLCLLMLNEKIPGRSIVGVSTVWSWSFFVTSMKLLTMVGERKDPECALSRLA